MLFRSPAGEGTGSAGTARGRGWDGSESVGKAAARSELWAGAAQTESTALSLSIGMVWVSFPPFEDLEVPRRAVLGSFGGSVGVISGFLGSHCVHFEANRGRFSSF